MKLTSGVNKEYKNNKKNSYKHNLFDLFPELWEVMGCLYEFFLLFLCLLFIPKMDPVCYETFVHCTVTLYRQDSYILNTSGKIYKICQELIYTFH